MWCLSVALVSIVCAVWSISRRALPHSPRQGIAFRYCSSRTDFLVPHSSVREVGSEMCSAWESSAGRSLRRTALSSCHTSLSYSEPRESPFYGEPALKLRALFRGVPFTLHTYPSEGEPFSRGTLSHAFWRARFTGIRQSYSIHASGRARIVRPLAVKPPPPPAQVRQITEHTARWQSFGGNRIIISI